jgi:hypothetical protein
MYKHITRTSAGLLLCTLLPFSALAEVGLDDKLDNKTFASTGRGNLINEQTCRYKLGLESTGVIPIAFVSKIRRCISDIRHQAAKDKRLEQDQKRKDVLRKKQQNRANTLIRTSRRSLLRAFEMKTDVRRAFYNRRSKQALSKGFKKIRAKLRTDKRDIENDLDDARQKAIDDRKAARTSCEPLSRGERPQCIRDALKKLKEEG